MPPELNYVQRVQGQSALAQQARELVMHEILVPLEEDEADVASSDLYSQRSPPTQSQ